MAKIVIPKGLSTVVEAVDPGTVDRQIGGLASMFLLGA